MLLRYVAAGMVVVGTVDLVFLNSVPSIGASALGRGMGTSWLLAWTALGALVGYYGFYTDTTDTRRTWVRNASWFGLSCAFSWLAVEWGFALHTLPDHALISGYPTLSFLVITAAAAAVMAGGHYLLVKWLNY